MRYLGVDYGERRVGIAVSDEEGKIAFPQRTVSVRSMREAVAAVRSVVKEQRVATVVVGMPAGLGGRDTMQTKRVRAFIRVLQRGLSVPIETENELLTTRLAVAAGGKKELRDASAAAIMLQSYLDKRRGD